MLDSPVARAIFLALAECWPEHVDVVRIEIADSESRGVVVSVWTTTPGKVIGYRGSAAAEIKERLRAAVPDEAVEFRVLPGALSLDPQDVLLEEGPLQEVAIADPGPTARDFVPDLVGMTVPDAYSKARSLGFALATADPDGVPITFDTAHGQVGQWVVMGQSPMPGVLAPLRSQIVVVIEERGGGQSGDREPRVPGPPGGIVRFERAIAVDDLD